MEHKKDNRKLRNLGLKVTTPRLRILQILEEASARHFSAEEIYKILSTSGEDVGLATVYRVLTQFVDAGLVKRQNFEEGRAVFELNQGEHHDHMVCVKCGQVQEFVDEAIEKRQREVARQAGFQMTDHSLVMHGICATCAK
jgi:Fur family transcriptional regulator, ferric uptake regulator